MSIKYIAIVTCLLVFIETKQLFCKFMTECRNLKKIHRTIGID